MIPVEPDPGLELGPELKPYSQALLFEKSNEFRRLARREPKKAQRMWTIGKVTNLRMEAIIQQLTEYGIDATPEAFEADAKAQTSAWAVGEAWLARGARTPDVFARDFVCFAACELWKRYLPERPSVEMLDDWIQEGYDLAMNAQAMKAVERWWPAWTVIRARLRPEMTTVDAATPVFDGAQCLYNWLQDLALELGNASRDRPKDALRGVELCEQVLVQFKDEPCESFVTAFRVDLADFLSMAGRPDEGESIFVTLIEEQPNKAIGYVHLSDHYAYPSKASGRAADINRATEILEKALRYPVIDADDYDLHVRLEDLKNKSKQTATEDTAPATRTVRP